MRSLVFCIFVYSAKCAAFCLTVYGLFTVFIISRQIEKVDRQIDFFYKQYNRRVGKDSEGRNHNCSTILANFVRFSFND